MKKNSFTTKNAKATKTNKIMNKAVPVLVLFILLIAKNCTAGINDAVTFNTNTYVVSPSNIWQTNEAAISSALEGAGFSSGSPNAVTNGDASPVGVNTNWTTGGNETISNNLTVDGPATFGANVTVNYNLQVDQQSVLEGNVLFLQNLVNDSDTFEANASGTLWAVTGIFSGPMSAASFSASGTLTNIAGGETNIIGPGGTTNMTATTTNATGFTAQGFVWVTNYFPTCVSCSYTVTNQMPIGSSVWSPFTNGPAAGNEWFVGNTNGSIAVNWTAISECPTNTARGYWQPGYAGNGAYALWSENGSGSPSTIGSSLAATLDIGTYGGFGTAAGTQGCSLNFTASSTATLDVSVTVNAMFMR
jgi:hypothetical protein